MILFSRRAFLILFHLTQWQKGTSENMLNNIHVPKLGHSRRALPTPTLASGEAPRSGLVTIRSPQLWGSPAGALPQQYPPSLDRCAARCPPRRHGGGQRLPGPASPLPHGPRGTGWVSRDGWCQLHTKAAYSRCIVLSGNTQLTALLPLPYGFCPLP